MGDLLRRDEDNPYVGGNIHKASRGAEMDGRTERRALERGYGMPGAKAATKKKRKPRKK